MSIYIKGLEVIKSCETPEQLEVAYKWILLAANYISFRNFNLLVDAYYDKLEKVYR